MRILSVASIERHRSTRRRIPEQSPMIDRKAGEPFQPCTLREGILIPQALLKDPTLSASARLLWGLLAHCQGTSLECFPLEETLAVFLSVQGRQLPSYLTELEDY